MELGPTAPGAVDAMANKLYLVNEAHWQFVSHETSPRPPHGRQVARTSHAQAATTRGPIALGHGLRARGPWGSRPGEAENAMQESVSKSHQRQLSGEKVSPSAWERKLEKGVLISQRHQRDDAKQSPDSQTGNDVSVRRVDRCRDRAAPVPTAGRDGQCVSEIVAKQPVKPPLDAMAISQRRRAGHA